MQNLKQITADTLICMNQHAKQYHYRIDLAYASDTNLLFGERIYKRSAQLWLHRDLANIVFHAAHFCAQEYGVHFILYDGLRTVDAQEKMLFTQRVKDNPQWLTPPRLLSPPGAGGHPRGMAIDIGLETSDKKLLDMGTAFDYLAENATAEQNPAHRDHPHNTNIQKNRSMLDKSMEYGAKATNTDLFLLPQEWWDFRLPPAIFEQYKPLSEHDLPNHMQMID